MGKLRKRLLFTSCWAGLFAMLGLVQQWRTGVRAFLPPACSAVVLSLKFRPRHVCPPPSLPAQAIERFMAFVDEIMAPSYDFLSVCKCTARDIARRVRQGRVGRAAQGEAGEGGEEEAQGGGEEASAQPGTLRTA